MITQKAANKRWHPKSYFTIVKVNDPQEKPVTNKEYATYEEAAKAMGKMNSSGDPNEYKVKTNIF